MLTSFLTTREDMILSTTAPSSSLGFSCKLKKTFYYQLLFMDRRHFLKEAKGSLTCKLHY